MQAQIQMYIHKVRYISLGIQHLNQQKYLNKTQFCKEILTKIQTCFKCNNYCFKKYSTDIKIHVYIITLESIIPKLNVENTNKAYYWHLELHLMNGIYVRNNKRTNHGSHRAENYSIPVLDRGTMWPSNIVKSTNAFSVWNAKYSMEKSRHNFRMRDSPRHGIVSAANMLIQIVGHCYRSLQLMTEPIL